MNGAASRWLLPLAFCGRTNRRAALPSRLALARVRRGRRLGLLTDAFALPDFAHRVVAALAAGKEFEIRRMASMRFRPDRSRRGNTRCRRRQAEVNWLSAEQSNSSLTIGDKVMLKIFRRISRGQHPEAEMNRYLTATALPTRRRSSATSCDLHATARRPRWPSLSVSSAIRAMPGRGSSII